MRRALLAAVLWSAPALAWESVCFDYPDKLAEPSALAATSAPPCAPSAGPATARNRWVGPLDEHRQLWESTRERAGLPAAVSATQVLTVYTSSATVRVGSADVGTLVPAPFEAATRVQQRAYSPGELAQLPDFAYSLWDWASGEETCPLDAATDAAACHEFASHMGPVNSNHFLPQARTFYAHSHGLALARAADCRALATQLGAAAGRFDDVLRACEVEALSLEAVGQHYLQDAWSSGHMWERWGSSSLADFPGVGEEKRDRAVLVALVAGLFHGARGVLQVLPEWTSFDVNDAMCAPWDTVRFATSAGRVERGLGDDYLAQLPPGAANASYDFQSQQLFDCAASGMLEVYRAAGEQHGAAQPGAGLRSVDPTGADCFGQRAVNAALLAGAAINVKVLGQQATVPIDARLVSWMLPQVARQQGKVPVSAKLRNEFRVSLQRVVSVVRLVAKDQPQGTALAQGRMGDFLGAKPNGQYSVAAGSLEPPLPWTGEGTGEAATRGAYLARTFHRAHAADLCAAYDATRLQALRTHAQDPALDAPSKAAACAACAELVVRHLRVGTAPGAYDTSREPLCHFLAPAPAFVYQQPSGAADPAALAAGFCCP